MNSAYSNTAAWKTAAAALLIFLSALAFYTAALGDRPFFTRGEGREALVVKAMLQQRNYILPLRNNREIPSKPPLYHWLSVICTKALGQPSEFAIRLPSALSAALGLAVFFSFISSISSYRYAALSALILATNLEWMRNAVHARVDMCFSLFICCTLYALYPPLTQWKTYRSFNASWFYIAGLSSALAVLTKGPAGLIVPAIIAAAYAFAYETPLKSAVKQFPIRQALTAFIVALFLAGVWYFAAYMQHGSAFLETQLWRENISRIIPLGINKHGHQKAFYSPFIHLAAGFMPWSLFFPVLAVWLYKKFNKKLNNNAANFRLYCQIWGIAFLLVVLLSESKRMVYLLPVYPALSYLTAASILEFRTDLAVFRYAVRISSSALIAVSLISALAALLLLRLPDLEINLIITYFLGSASSSASTASAVVASICKPPGALVLALLCVVLLSLAAAASWRRVITQSAALCASATVIVSLFLNIRIMPAAANIKSPRAFMEAANNSVPPQAALVQFRHNFFAAQFYSTRPLIFAKTAKALLKEAAKSGSFIVLREDDLSEVKSLLGAVQIIHVSRNYAANGKGRLVLLQRT